MKLVLPLIVLALCLAPSAASTPRRSTGARIVTGLGPQVVESEHAIPGPANTVVNVAFNGHEAQAVWADSQRQMEAAWHGVLIIITAQKGRGPATVRAISARRDHVRVYVRFSWK